MIIYSIVVKESKQLTAFACYIEKFLILKKFDY